jgi:hypothetical protein
MTAPRRRPVQALVPSCGEHCGRDAKGRRRPKPLQEKPTSTPSRTPLRESRGNHPCRPTLLHACRRAEPGDPTPSARRIASPKTTAAHKQPEITAYSKPAASWHVLVVQSSPSGVSYFIDSDSNCVAKHPGKYAPRVGMAISFNFWFDGLAAGSTDRSYHEWH